MTTNNKLQKLRLQFMQWFFAVVIALFLSGCSSFSTKASNTDTTPLNKTTPSPSSNQYKPIPVDTLYTLIAAELAGKRRQYDTSMLFYIDEARSTRDPDVAERAVKISQFVGSAPHLNEALDIWLEVEPNNPEALSLGARAAAKQQQWQKAFKYLDTLTTLGESAPYDFIAAEAGRADSATNQQLQQEFQRLALKYPDNPNLPYAMAITEQNQQRYKVAIQFIDRALKIDRQHINATIQRGRLLALDQRQTEAIEWIKKAKRTFPANKTLLNLLGQLQLDSGNLEEARDTYKTLKQVLNNNGDNDSSALLSLALIEQQLGDLVAAEKVLMVLQQRRGYSHKANYYLGKLARDNGQLARAIDHFVAVERGRELLPAILNAAQLMTEQQSLDDARQFIANRRNSFPSLAIDLLRIETQILIEQQQPTEAMLLLTEALQVDPNNTQIRYARAMLAEQLDDLELLETDLRQVIEQQPNNAEALNALGYTLANRTERFEDARVLIERALELAPNNPAILDSMGWLLFRQGQLEQAEPLLKRAFNLLPDHEIAAHYGELLWVIGQINRAKEIWQRGLQQTPESEIIEQTRKRLGLEPL